MIRIFQVNPIRIWPFLGVCSLCLCALLLALVIVLYGTPYDSKWWLVMAALLALAFLGPLVLIAVWRGLAIAPPPRESRFFVPVMIAICLAVGWSLGTFLHAFAFGRPESLTVSPPGALKTHYLIDYEFVRDERKGHATLGHLLAFNPGSKPAHLAVTIYFEDQEPRQFSLEVPARQTLNSVYEDWPVEPNSRFALKIDSDEPVITQATLGWTNTMGDYTVGAPTNSPGGPRETAKSYMASPGLGTRCFVADGIVIDRPGVIWLKESEHVLLLNPGDTEAKAELVIYGGIYQESHKVRVPPRRLVTVSMDTLVTPNLLYSVQIDSNVPIAGRWLRTVSWYDSDELMAYWSVPCVPFKKTAVPAAN